MPVVPGGDWFRRRISSVVRKTVNAGEHLKPRALKRANASTIKGYFTRADFALALA